MRKAIPMRETLLILITTALPLLACAPGPGPPVAELRVGVGGGQLVYAASTRVPVEWKLLEPANLPSPALYLFVHFVDENGDILRVFDRPMPAASEPFEHIEIWQSALAEPLPRGSYRLITGIYDVASGRHWQLETNGAAIRKGKYEIAEIEIDSTDRKTPDIGFEGDWLSPNIGQKHNPGRRWLGKGGAIRLQGNTRWSELVLGISIIELPDHQLAMEDASEPQLVISNGCDASVDQSADDAGNGGEDGSGDVASKRLVTGYGFHWLNLRLEARDDCSIVLKPNFTMLDLESYITHSVGLESAYFRSAHGT